MSGFDANRVYSVSTPQRAIPQAADLPSEAEKALLDAQSLYNEINDRLGSANSLRSLGDLYVRLSRLDKAEKALLAAQSLYDEINAKFGRECRSELSTTDCYATTTPSLRYY